ALWKYRGLGELAAAPAEPVRLASAGSLFDRLHQPKLNSWNHLHQVILGFREHYWIARVIEWVPVAGVIALLLRSRRGFLLVGTWFTAYLLVKGTYELASLDDATFFRLLMPAFPAYVLLAASIVLLIPGLRAQPTPSKPILSAGRLRAGVVAAAVVFGALP